MSSNYPLAKVRFSRVIHQASVLHAQLLAGQTHLVKIFNYMFLFHRFLQERYPIVRSNFPGEGRRQWRLRAIEGLWLAPDAQAEIASTALTSLDSPQTETHERDTDPLDHLTDGEEVGLLVRTDFTDQIAWDEFLRQFRESERALLDSFSKSAARDDTTTYADAEMEEDASESESDPDSTPEHIIKVLSCTGDSLFEDISNLTALRLLNDVDLRLAPPVPSGVTRIQRGNRLIDSNGLQEVYRGKTIWIYDKKSNVDASVRLVGPQGDIYGTATGDSWRARAQHVAELQFSMSYGNVRINFGGLDRWDQSERARNMKEAEK